MTARHVPAEQARPLRLELDQVRRCLSRRSFPAFLESGPGFGAHGRWSILAARPRLTICATDLTWSVRGAGFDQSGVGDPLMALGQLLKRLGIDSTAPPDGEAPFRGGLIGYFGYDLAPRIEKLPRRAPRDSNLPDFWFGLYDTFVRHDRASGRSHLVGVDLTGEGERDTRRRLNVWEAELSDEAPVPGCHAHSLVGMSSPDTPTRRARSLVTPDQYHAGVARILDYLAAGDVFQVNLSQRFEAIGSFDALDLHERLMKRSPAPFAALIGLEEGWLISSSPELFYETRGRQIMTRPIKGTRPRGATVEQDAQLRQELADSAKDRAELAMIIDLERNDLGRVCEYGSVRVVEPFAIESFAQVHHRVATIEGRLRPEIDPIDVVRAMFPGGSITGAPKIRAMQIIDELEPCRRGPYTGSIGYYSFGASAFNIAIRTMVLEGDRLTFQVGGGIVADSDPDAEYQETLDKARGMLDVAEGRA